VIEYLQGLIHGQIEEVERLSVLPRVMQGTRYTLGDLTNDSKAMLVSLEASCHRLDLPSSATFIHGFIEDLELEPDADEIAGQLSAIVKLVKQEAGKRIIFCVRKDKSDVLTRNFKVWSAIAEAFPSADSELLSALRCYQFEENTACVFHLMRAAEHGLRALARERQVTFPNKPIEWAQWQNLLTEIDKRVDVQWAHSSPGPAKDAALGFYKGAVAHFHAFKDKYRNAVMHVRRQYDEHDALQAINQVRDFMHVLSSKIGEKTKKPIQKWP